MSRPRMAMSINLSGEKEILEMIQKFSQEKTGVLRRATQAGTKPLAAAVKRNVKAQGGRRKFTTAWSGPSNDKEKRIIWEAMLSPAKFGSVKGKRGIGFQRTLLVAGKTGALGRSIKTKIHMAKARRTATTASGRRPTTAAQWKGARWKSVSSGRVVGVVGPAHVRLVAYSPWTRKIVRVDPYNYARLVENGHALKIRGQNKGQVKPRPFIVPAYLATKGQVVSNIRSTLRSELSRLMVARKPRALSRAGK